MTALRVTPPNCLAIWLADRPSSQSFFKVETRSSVQLITRLRRFDEAESVPTLATPYLVIKPPRRRSSY